MACSKCNQNHDPNAGCLPVDGLTTGSSISFCSPSQIPLPNPLPDDIPATAVIAESITSCPNGNPVPSVPPTNCGENDAQALLKQLQQAVYCVLNAQSVAVSTGSCNVLMAVNGSVKLKQLGDAIAECWTQQPPSVSCTSIKSALTKDGCIAAGSLTHGIGFDAGGALKYGPFANPETPNCNRFIQEFRSSANGGCVQQDTTPASFGVGLLSNGNVILRPLPAGNSGSAIACADLLAKSAPSSAGGCFPNATDSITSVLSYGSSGVAYRVLPASSGGSNISCSVLGPLLKASSSGGCFPIATEPKPSHVLGLTSSGNVEYFPECSALLASLKRGSGGCIPDKSTPIAVIGADSNGDAGYMQPLPLYHFEAHAGGASANSQTMTATYGTANNVTSLWNSAFTHETGLRGASSAWGGGATGTWTAPRAMRAMITGSLFGRARASGGAALLNHAYMGIVVIRAAGTAAGQPTFAISTVYRFAQAAFYADGLDNDFVGCGAIVLELQAGDRINLRMVVTNTPSTTSTLQSLSVRDDGATMLSISEIPTRSVYTWQ